MSKPSLLQLQRELVRDLKAAALARAKAESGLVAAVQKRVDQTLRTWEAAQHSLLARFHAESLAADELRATGQDKLKGDIAEEQEAIKFAFAEAKENTESQYHQEKTATTKEFTEARWTNRMVYEANKNAAQQQQQEATHKAESAVSRFQAILADAIEYLMKCRLSPYHAEVPVVAPLEADEVPREPLRELEEQLETAEKQLERLKALQLPKLIRPWWIVALTVLLAVAIIVPTIIITKDPLFGAVIGTGSALVIGIGVYFGLRSTASAQVARVCRPLTHAVAEGRMLKDHCLQQATRIYRRQVAGFQKQRQAEKIAVDETYKPKLEEMKKRRITELRRSTTQYQPQLAALQARFEFEQHRLETDHQSRKAAAKEKYEQDLAQAEAVFEGSKTEIQQLQADLFQQMASAWRAAIAAAKQRADAVVRESDVLFPTWSELAKRGPTKLDTIPEALRVGSYILDVAALPSGVPVDPQLRKESALRWELPALVPFPTPGNLLLRAASAGERQESVKLLQSVMLRYLTGLPAGKVKLTVIDPVGLGENFAAFMHLADYDETLIAHRIWTEPAHIEHRLADLTAHMESIIQKYLRNQYASIEAYNAAAGEVAEPFRVLVVAGFPVNFTTDAARRLVSVVSSGARCGVVTLLAVDTKQDLPDGFHLKDIEPLCQGVAWKGEKPLLADDDFADLPLVLDAPPEADLATAIITKVGAAAKDAQRVEVPFDFISPDRTKWWKGDSGLNVTVPLGRVGATRRQALALGQGTAQHVLIAGKTGSGKSTLLHVLITSCVQNYAPEQVELYLVDFKKGVEFKPYASHATPHVKVVAIESEREFGLSVLQRLDVELKRRGDRYRQLGAQDIAAARAADPANPYPRILLIVDEFQEFFVEDDRLAQEAALVMDRLVRQGRAFGIHVILGSQTIGGAYTLARSTIDQMAVRIALPCSEADGHLILSEENSAARLLSRPGDAIYNDMSGLVEGNHPFQVAWLPDETREEILVGVDALNKQRTVEPSEPLVFEGNAAADLRKNPLLREALKRRPTSVPKELQAWIGEPIAIKEPTAALFRRQSGRHLTIIGQDEEAALGIFCSSLLSLAAQLPAAARFHLFTAVPDAEDLKPLAGLAALLPQRPSLLGPRELNATLAELTAELAARQQPGAAEGPPHFLFVYGLHRLRDLRKAEDDFGSYGKQAELTPSQQFTQLIKEGPGLGLHVIAWADSLGGLMRSIDRQTLRDVEMRVLFQMSGGDSSNLIDTPLASKLGMHRALFASEDVGKLEKFRPYGPPSAETLEWLKGQVGAERQG